MKAFAFACFIFASTILFASAQTELVIKSLDKADTFFSEASNASSYRVEWAPSDNGLLTNFVGESTVLLNNLLPSGSGFVTASVAMFYRVVASVLTLFSVINSGSSAYLINGESNPALTLTRGQTYIIEVNSPNHPFWIKFFPYTGAANHYNEGLNTNGVQGGKIIYSVPEEGPDTPYYACQFHETMQGMINIVDPQDPNPPAPAGMSLIPAGEFVMGDAMGVDGAGVESSTQGHTMICRPARVLFSAWIPCNERYEKEPYLVGFRQGQGPLLGFGSLGRLPVAGA